MSDYQGIKRTLLQTPGRLFEDSTFPASNTSLYVRQPRSPDDIEWRRPHEIVPDPKFAVKGVQFVDIDQGWLGDCWFVAAAATVAVNHKSLFYRVVPQDQEFDKDYAGIFRFYFWQYGEWKEVVVDDRLPTLYGKLIYTHNMQQTNEFWVPLLEKAYAKLHGCYDLLDGGRIHEALIDLTGGISELLILKDATEEELAPTLVGLHEMATLMGGAIFPSRDARRENERANGLYEGHAYSIITMKTVTYRKQKKLLLYMRNPFGKGEWKGAWSDGSKEWTEVSPADREAEAKVKGNNGEFWMSLEDVIKNFDELELCHLSVDAVSPDLFEYGGERKHWTFEDFTGRWLRGVSAGGPMSSFTSRLFWTNPQYRVKLENTNKKKTSVVVSLMEVMDRAVRTADDVRISFVIFKLKPGREPEGPLNADNYYEYTPQLVETQGGRHGWPYRELAVHYNLDPGTYVIVPNTSQSNMEAEFYLRVFSEVASSAKPLTDSVGPTEEIEVVPEDLIESLFHKQKTFEGRVDAFGLQRILEQAKTEEYGRSDGYSLETCRSFVSLLDTDIVTGGLTLDKVKTVWKYVQSWTRQFRSADVTQDNRVNAFELKELYKKTGFRLDTGTLQRIVRRYGGHDGLLHEDDFLQSFCRLMTLYYIFKKKSASGTITRNLSEWLSDAMYL
ncbi:calpain-1 catalytic subunit-like [Littorina saxatilis]|uniref:Calpain catalytic domain-containing protein n=1 Tax=Littorina saxatilis TaxID=31220 RepID=A0AAN9GLY6_9CAEN